MSSKPFPNTPTMFGRRLPGAQREEHLPPYTVLPLLEIERRLTFVTQHFKHGGTLFIGNFHTGVLQRHHVNL
ncbi:MAG: hypothetical protein GEV06_20760 [Luteitalea sp.]|nr:hypothetical protein [Luteitalea sp.]